MKRWLWTGIVMVAATGPTGAGRPLAVDDADPADAGVVEVEAGVVIEETGDNRYMEVPAGVAAGIGHAVELGVGFGWQRNEDGGADEEGVTDLVIGGKWQFVASCPLGARHALAPSVKLPTADEDGGLGSGEADADLTWIMSRPFGKAFQLHVNAGYTWIGGPDEDAIHYGAALDWVCGERCQWVAEVFAEQPVSGGGSTPVLWNMGLRWTVQENLTLDFAGGSHLNGDTPDIVTTVGMTWAFEPGGKED